MLTNTLIIDYPVGRAPRYPLLDKPHPLLAAKLERNRHIYQDTLRICLEYVNDLKTIACSDDAEGIKPYWVNGFIPGMDGVTLYSLTANRKPKIFLEIGSGNSTRFIAKAIREHSPATKLISIDPAPRAVCDSLCNEIHRKPLEELDLSLFAQIEAGDIIFMDGSHRCFMHTDTTVFFLDVLPQLPHGVWVGIHDICLPFDYPESTVDWFWSEQYLLACYLLGDCPWLEVILPSVFASADPELSGILKPLWENWPAGAIEQHGSIFWMRICRDGRDVSGFKP